MKGYIYRIEGLKQFEIEGLKQFEIKRLLNCSQSYVSSVVNKKL
jgi:hypothetical protein